MVIFNKPFFYAFLFRVKMLWWVLLFSVGSNLDTTDGGYM